MAGRKRYEAYSVHEADTWVIKESYVRNDVKVSRSCVTTYADNENGDDCQDICVTKTMQFPHMKRLTNLRGEKVFTDTVVLEQRLDKRGILTQEVFLDAKCSGARALASISPPSIDNFLRIAIQKDQMRARVL